MTRSEYENRHRIARSGAKIFEAPSADGEKRKNEEEEQKRLKGQKGVPS